MKQLNWTEKDREDFLRKMLADALLRQQRQKLTGENLPAPGSLQSPLLGGGPRLLNANPANNPGQVTADRPEAPPEVREAQRIFRGDTGTTKKGG